MLKLCTRGQILSDAKTTGNQYKRETHLHDLPCKVAGISGECPEDFLIP